MLMPQPFERDERSSEPSSAASAAPVTEQMSLEQLRVELDKLRDRERQIIQLLGVKSPDRLLHDLRNVLNELQLLRILADQSNK